MSYATKLAGSAAVIALMLGASVQAGEMGKTAGEAVMVGGAEMSPSKTIVENAANSEDHETLVAAVQAADLAETLSGEGPFTVFAPTDDAFAALPEGTVETLLEPANKDALTGVLTYHVVPAAVTATDLVGLIDANGGEATIETVSGAPLTAKREGEGIIIEDAAGNTATVTIADVSQSNGVIHVIDTVLLPG